MRIVKPSTVGKLFVKIVLLDAMVASVVLVSEYYVLGF